MPEELELAGTRVPVDRQGYLINLDDWSPDVAQAIAAKENIDLSDEHWEVISLLREFYAQHDLSPMMRILVNQMRDKFGSNKGNSLYLMQLFPEYPALVACKIAGLPRPTNCP